jgi:p-hydroxybenzoate 3-monooxygenase
MTREGLVHRGIELRFGGSGHRVAFEDLVPGRTITVYGQQEVVKDLIAARLEAGGDIRFDVSDVRLDGIDSEKPRVLFTEDGQERTLDCDVIAGCDGFHGVSRPSIPDGVLTEYDHTYPFAWLGVLAEVAPSTEELIYSNSERGFALHSMRSPHITRLYLQVPPDDDADAWGYDRIWSELRARFATDAGFELADGPILEKSIAAVRSFAVEPMQYGRLYLAGDAAHIVPPTGAKGLNLAVADVGVLAEALHAWYTTGDRAGLDGYSRACLRRVWRAQHFSYWMTSLTHRLTDDPYQLRLQRSYLDYVTTSRAAATTLAENYVGLASV